MTPLDDPRPIAEVLRDWRERRGLSLRDAAALIPAQHAAWRKWESGAPCPMERPIRALLTLMDEGRA